MEEAALVDVVAAKDKAGYAGEGHIVTITRKDGSLVEGRITVRSDSKLTIDKSDDESVSDTTDVNFEDIQSFGFDGKKISPNITYTGPIKDDGEIDLDSSNKGTLTFPKDENDNVSTFTGGKITIKDGEIEALHGRLTTTYTGDVSCSIDYTVDKLKTDSSGFIECEDKLKVEKKLLKDGKLDVQKFFAESLISDYWLTNNNFNNLINYYYGSNEMPKLHKAAFEGKPLDSILSKLTHSEINKKDELGFTAFDYAFIQGNTKAVIELLSKGANLADLKCFDISSSVRSKQDLIEFIDYISLLRGLDNQDTPFSASIAFKLFSDSLQASSSDTDLPKETLDALSAYVKKNHEHCKGLRDGIIEPEYALDGVIPPEGRVFYTGFKNHATAIVVYSDFSFDHIDTSGFSFRKEGGLFHQINKFTLGGSGEKKKAAILKFLSESTGIEKARSYEDSKKYTKALEAFFPGKGFLPYAESGVGVKGVGPQRIGQKSGNCAIICMKEVAKLFVRKHLEEKGESEEKIAREVKKVRNILYQKTKTHLSELDPTYNLTERSIETMVTAGRKNLTTEDFINLAHKYFKVEDKSGNKRKKAKEFFKKTIEAATEAIKVAETSAEIADYEEMKKNAEKFLKTFKDDKPVGEGVLKAVLENSGALSCFSFFMKTTSEEKVATADADAVDEKLRDFKDKLLDGLSDDSKQEHVLEFEINPYVTGSPSTFSFKREIRKGPNPISLNNADSTFETEWKRGPGNEVQLINEKTLFIKELHDRGLDITEKKDFINEKMDAIHKLKVRIFFSLTGNLMIIPDTEEEIKGFRGFFEHRTKEQQDNFFKALALTQTLLSHIDRRFDDITFEKDNSLVRHAHVRAMINRVPGIKKQTYPKLSVRLQALADAAATAAAATAAAAAAAAATAAATAAAAASQAQGKAKTANENHTVKITTKGGSIFKGKITPKDANKLTISDGSKTSEVQINDIQQFAFISADNLQVSTGKYTGQVNPDTGKPEGTGTLTFSVDKKFEGKVNDKGEIAGAGILSVIKGTSSFEIQLNDSLKGTHTYGATPIEGILFKTFTCEVNNNGSIVPKSGVFTFKDSSRITNLQCDQVTAKGTPSGKRVYDFKTNPSFPFKTLEIDGIQSDGKVSSSGKYTCPNGDTFKFIAPATPFFKPHGIPTNLNGTFTPKDGVATQGKMKADGHIETAAETAAAVAAKLEAEQAAAKATVIIPPNLPGYDSNFRGMKYNDSMRPAKTFVRELMNIPSTFDVQDDTTKGFKTDILTKASYRTATNGATISRDTLNTDLNESGISFATNSGLTFEKYKETVARSDVHNADYNGFRSLTANGKPLMLQATQIVTSCPVRFTHDLTNPGLNPFEGSLDNKPKVTMLNASGIDFNDPSGPGIILERDNPHGVQPLIEGLFDALSQRIKAEKLTHVSLIQIGMGEFLGYGDKIGSTEIRKSEFYKNGILKLVENCDKTKFYLPNHLFSDAQRAEINAAGVISHDHDAAALAQYLSDQPNTNVGMLNPSDPTVTYGALPFGALSMTGTGGDFVGEEFLGQVTTGSAFNARLLVKVIEKDPAKPAADPAAKGGGRKKVDMLEMTTYAQFVGAWKEKGDSDDENHNFTLILEAIDKLDNKKLFDFMDAKNIRSKGGWFFKDDVPTVLYSEFVKKKKIDPIQFCVEMEINNFKGKWGTDNKKSLLKGLINDLNISDYRLFKLFQEKNIVLAKMGNPDEAGTVAFLLQHKRNKLFKQLQNLTPPVATGTTIAPIPDKVVQDPRNFVVTLNGHGSFSDQLFKVPEGVIIAAPGNDGYSKPFIFSAQSDKPIEQDLYKGKGIYPKSQDEGDLPSGWRFYTAGELCPNVQFSPWKGDSEYGEWQKYAVAEDKTKVDGELKGGKPPLFVLLPARDENKKQIEYKGKSKSKVPNKIKLFGRTDLEAVCTSSKIKGTKEDPVILMPFNCNANHLGDPEISADNPDTKQGLEDIIASKAAAAATAAAATAAAAAAAATAAAKAAAAKKAAAEKKVAGKLEAALTTGSPGEKVRKTRALVRKIYNTPYAVSGLLREKLGTHITIADDPKLFFNKLKAGTAQAEVNAFFDSESIDDSNGRHIHGPDHAEGVMKLTPHIIDAFFDAKADLGFMKPLDRKTVNDQQAIIEFAVGLHDIARINTGADHDEYFNSPVIYHSLRAYGLSHAEATLYSYAVANKNSKSFNEFDKKFEGVYNSFTVPEKQALEHKFGVGVEPGSKKNRVNCYFKLVCRTAGTADTLEIIRLSTDFSSDALNSGFKKHTEAVNKLLAMARSNIELRKGEELARTLDGKVFPKAIECPNLILSEGVKKAAAPPTATKTGEKIVGTHVNGNPISFVKSDIVKTGINPLIDIDKKPTVIVNAAKSDLKGGGGVDGAIHNAAGNAKLVAVNKTKSDGTVIYPDKVNAGDKAIKSGEACISDSFGLREQMVTQIIHVVAENLGKPPNSRLPTQKEKNDLKQSYIECLRLANKNGHKVIAFPGIGTGAFGWTGVQSFTLLQEALNQVEFAGVFTQVLIVDDLSENKQIPEDFERVFGNV